MPPSFSRLLETPQPFYSHVDSREPSGSFPSRYGVDRIVLQPRDPWWLYAYWELLPSTVAKGQAKLKEITAQWILRVYEKGTPHRFDLDVSVEEGEWTFEVTPNREWVVEIGLKSSDGEFIALARSNKTRTPPDCFATAWTGFSSMEGSPFTRRGPLRRRVKN